MLRKTGWNDIADNIENGSPLGKHPFENAFLVSFLPVSRSHLRETAPCGSSCATISGGGRGSRGVTGAWELQEETALLRSTSIIGRTFAPMDMANIKAHGFDFMDEICCLPESIRS